jgi:hypothetical protein
MRPVRIVAFDPAATLRPPCRVRFSRITFSISSSADHLIKRFESQSAFSILVLVVSRG